MLSLTACNIAICCVVVDSNIVICGVVIDGNVVRCGSRYVVSSLTVMLSDVICCFIIDYRGCNS